MENRHEKVSSLLLVVGLLMTETNKYLYSIAPETKFEFKQKCNGVITANTLFLKAFDDDIPQAQMEDLGETFSGILEKLSKEPTEKQIELISLINDWLAWNVKIQY